MPATKCNGLANCSVVGDCILLREIKLYDYYFFSFFGTLCHEKSEVHRCPKNVHIIYFIVVSTNID